MKILTPQELSGDSLVDQALTLLLQWLLASDPPTCLEGRYLESGELEWKRTHRGEVETQVMPGKIFRPLMARLAVVSGASDYYGDVATFAWERPGETCYLRYFFCNEPKMDYWFRLYLYGKSEDVARVEVT